MHETSLGSVRRRSGAASAKRAVKRIGITGAAVAALVVPLSLAGQSGIASAATPGPTTCGTPTGPAASLAGGSYTTVTVAGVCQVNAGQVVTSGDVTVQPGASLIAIFANNDAGSGTSGITVGGNINVGSGGTLMLGCEFFEFACNDDPGNALNPPAPTLSSADTVQGSIETPGALGVIVHNTTVGGDVVDTGGGSGFQCTGNEVFGEFAQAPIYTDYEDMTIGGNMRLTGITSCYLAALRDKIGGSATFANNNLLLPDSSETTNNTISGNLLCSGNSPATQYGDSGASPNVVGGSATGECAFGVTSPNPNSPSGLPAPISTPSTALHGYWLGAADGGIFSYAVPFFGSQGSTALSQPITGMAAVPGGNGGYNLAEANGMVYGDGPHSGDCTNVSGPLNQTIVGIAAAPGGNGCWLAGSGGQVFPMGSNAPFFGSAGGLSLTKPIVGIAATPNNDGYDLAASDGGVFTYGPGAAYYGSMGGKALNQPVVGIATDPVTGGYWLVAKDGGVFAFNAPFLGSMGGKPLNAPVVGIAAAPTGDGYYLVASDGGVFAFGTGAHFQGSAGSLKLNKPVVAMSLG